MTDDLVIPVTITIGSKQAQGSMKFTIDVLPSLNPNVASVAFGPGDTLSKYIMQSKEPHVPTFLRLLADVIEAERGT